MNDVRRWGYFFLLTFLFAMTNRISAQANVASLDGQVSDSSGAAVENARITLVDLSTNETRRQMTNHSGAFTFLALTPGHYQLRATKKSFNVAEVRLLTLNVNDQRHLILKMTPGSVSVVVDVVANTLINTDSATTTTFDRTFIEDMPLNGRTFQNLIELAPGVAPTVGGPGQFTVNGMRSTENYFTVDGVSANVGVSSTATSTGPLGFGSYSGGALPAFNSWGGTNSLLSVDALEEFKVDTAGTTSEFGRGLGGEVQIRSRSGSNTMHGSASEFFRNEALNANDWFFDHYIDPTTGLWSPQRKAETRMNNFGGTLGGPILRNKLFYFGTYEGMRTKIPVLLTSYSPMPYVRAQLTGIIKTIVNAFPAATGTEVTAFGYNPASNSYATAPQGYGSYAGTQSTINDLNSYAVRIDYNPFSKLTLFVRGSYAPTSTGTLTGPAYQRGTTNLKFVTLGATYSATEHLSNDLRFNWTVNEGHGYQTLVSSNGSTPFGYSDVAPPNYNERNSFVSFNVLQGGLSVGSSADNMMRQLNLSDSTYWNRGHHTLSFGVDYRYLYPIFEPSDYTVNYTFGSYLDLTGFTTTTSYRANGYLIPAGTVFPQGTLSGITYSAGEHVTTIQHSLALYASDKYQVNGRLTLNLGLRWDFDPPAFGTKSKPLYTLTGWAVGSNDYSNLALTPGAPTYPTRLNAFSPRVGVSYIIHKTPNQATVFHAAFNLNTSVGSLGGANAAGYFPYYRSSSIVPTAGYLSYPLAPSLLVPAPDKVVTGSLIGQTFSVFDPNYRVPYSYQETAAIQQQLTPSTTISIGYVGTNGRALLHRSLYQVPVSGASTTFAAASIYTESNADGYADSSDYNALQATIQKNLTKGLQFYGSYTWAHAFDTDSQDLLSTTLSTTLNTSNSAQINANAVASTRGPAATDMRNRVTFVATYQPLKLKTGDNFAAHIADSIINGWTFAPTFTIQSGTPISIYYTRALSSTNTISLRPDRNLAAPVWLSDSTVIHGRRLNPAAFTVPATAIQGNAPRNAISGFATETFDASIARQFPLTHRFSMRFRADIFNVLNHPSFPNPTGFFGSIAWNYALSAPGAFTVNSNFGSLGSNSTNTTDQNLAASQANTGGLSSLFQSSAPRATQLSLKLVF